MGIEEEDLSTDASRRLHDAWKARACQPNYYRSLEGVDNSCPPYTPSRAGSGQDSASSATKGDHPFRHRSGPQVDPARLQISESNHDTIGMVIVDGNGDIACGTTTNGAANKVAGRVGDSPVAGAGCYVDNDVGGAAATGDGDVMMRWVR